MSEATKGLSCQDCRFCVKQIVEHNLGLCGMRKDKQGGLIVVDLDRSQCSIFQTVSTGQF